MSYKIIILGPSAAGKSTLMRYLRKHTNLRIAEMDEEVTKANDNKWPSDNDYKDQILVPKIVENIIKEDKIIYIASYIPTKLVKKSRQKGFKIVLLQLEHGQFTERNAQRIKIEGYDDASPWFKMQLENYQKLKDTSLVDEVIDAHEPTSEIADKVLKLAKS